MKATGIVRRIDELGRIVIPKELRRTMNIKDGDPLELWIDGDKIVWRKYEPLLTVAESVEKLALLVHENKDIKGAQELEICRKLDELKTLLNDEGGK